jgi:hypothetical protein
MPVIIWVAIGLLTGAALLKFWNHIADWMIRTILPWFRQNLPEIEPLVRQVFYNIDKALAPMILELRKKWERLKDFFIGQLVEYKRIDPDTYKQKTKNYFRSENGEYIEEVRKRKINPIELPGEFRDKVIGEKHSKINTTEHVETTVKQMDIDTQL